MNAPSVTPPIWWGKEAGLVWTQPIAQPHGPHEQPQISFVENC